MNNQTNKYSIRIPDDISLIYHEKKQTLIFKGRFIQTSLQLQFKIFINQTKQILHISPITFSKISNNYKKKIKTLRNTTVVLIKHAIIETSTLIYKKLKINGVGYRIFFTEKFNNKLLTCKLGYSHLLYFKIPDDIMVNCFTKNKLSVFGNSYQNVSCISSLLRSYKLPDPYKGKGVLYEDEKINLKEGKKV